MGRLPFTGNDRSAADGSSSTLDSISLDRRTLLKGGGGLAAASVVSGCLGDTSVFSTVKFLSPQLASTAPDDAVFTSFDPDELTGEPMRTRLVSVDGTTVVFQYGQPVPSFDTWRGNAETRSHQMLSGTWRFRFDGQNQGLEQEWHRPEYEATDWMQVDVPRPWDLYDTPGFDSYDGSWYGEGTAFTDGYAWYRTRFDAPEEWANRTVRLNFLGVNYMAWVFLDGRLVGIHEGGHTPFALDVSDKIQPDTEHVLAVRVLRPATWNDYLSFDPTEIVDVDSVPAGPVDFWPYAGITRDVYLTVTPRVTISKVLTDARDGTLSARVVISNLRPEPARRMVTVDPDPDTGGTPRSKPVDIEPNSVRVVPFEIPIPDAAPWSTESPTLYEAVATLSASEGTTGEGEDDALATRYGLRAFEARDGRLRLNDDPVFLKGVNWHEETPTKGRSLTRADYELLLARVGDLGANFMRNSHYNRHPFLYEATDEAGILVADEPENMWLDAPEQRAQVTSYGLSRALVATMVWNQHNHPSVALWSVQNESDPFNSAYPRWIQEMRSTAAAVDLQERPITWSSKTPMDPTFGRADVIGLNEYYGYFGGSDEDLGSTLDRLHSTYPETPILITENGSWSAPELRGPPEDSPTSRGTPEWQARKFLAHWRQATADHRRGYVAGYTYWNLKDYKQRMDYNRFTYNGISTMGLLSFDGQHETAAYQAFKNADW